MFVSNIPSSAVDSANDILRVVNTGALVCHQILWRYFIPCILHDDMFCIPNGMKNMIWTILTHSPLAAVNSGGANSSLLNEIGFQIWQIEACETDIWIFYDSVRFVESS